MAWLLRQALGGIKRKLDAREEPLTCSLGAHEELTSRLDDLKCRLDAQAVLIRELRSKVIFPDSGCITCGGLSPAGLYKKRKAMSKLDAQEHAVRKLTSEMAVQKKLTDRCLTRCFGNGSEIKECFTKESQNKESEALRQIALRELTTLARDALRRKMGLSAYAPWHECAEQLRNALRTNLGLNTETSPEDRARIIQVGCHELWALSLEDLELLDNNSQYRRRGNTAAHTFSREDLAKAIFFESVEHRDALYRLFRLIS